VRRDEETDLTSRTRPFKSSSARSPISRLTPSRALAGVQSFPGVYVSNAKAGITGQYVASTYLHVRCPRARGNRTCF
jgi:hypothetical protein